jgi:hypothetical protein
VVDIKEFSHRRSVAAALRASLLASCVRRSPLASFVDETQSRAQFVKQEKVARK